MNLIERATVRPTRHATPRVQPLDISMYVEHIDKPMSGLGVNFQHRLELIVGCFFSANQAQYNDALRNAQKLIVREAYRDVLCRTAALRSALFGHDIEQALKIVDEIDEQIGF